MSTWRSLAAMILAGLTAAGGCAEEITVFAAASLTDALREIGAGFERATGTRVVGNFGASSLLARQVEEGAPADLFISADEAKMDRLVAQQLVLAETRKSRLANVLVIVVAADSPLRLASARDLAGLAIKRIAVAEPRTVPAGIYAKAYLENCGLWAALQPKIVPTDNVRGALAAVEAGNVEVGIVYRTDAALARRARVAWEVPAGETPAISYPMAVVKATAHLEAARRFWQHLDSAAAAQVFRKHGFIVRE